MAQTLLKPRALQQAKDVRDALPQLTGDVHTGRTAPSVAARRLLDLFH